MGQEAFSTDNVFTRTGKDMWMWAKVYAWSPFSSHVGHAAFGIASRVGARAGTAWLSNQFSHSSLLIDVGVNVSMFFLGAASANAFFNRNHQGAHIQSFALGYLGAELVARGINHFK